MKSKNPGIDWQELYIEIASSIPNDPRFSADRFYTHTSIPLILDTVAAIRKQEYRRLHNESVPLSLLTAATVAPNAKRPEEVKATDYQPYRHLVEEPDTQQIPYSSMELDYIQLALRTGLAPPWLGSIVRDSIKERELEYHFTPIAFTAPNFIGLGPYLKKDVIGFQICFTGFQPPKPSLNIYLQKKLPNIDKITRKWGNIEIPREFQQPDLAIQRAEFPYTSENPKYWRN